MNQIQTFNFNTSAVRTILRDGEPWFVAADVCGAIELSNTSQALADNVDRDDISTTDVTDSIGRSQATRLVNESGLYALIFGSRKEEAKVFKRWVTSEVLPSIRKTGSYNAPLPSAPASEVVQLQLALMSAQMSSDILGITGAARLGMVHKAHELAGAKHLLPMLPVYAVDAPPRHRRSFDRHLRFV